jgi:pyruvate dehydrogenase E2 component (dihydrolipoamide acetyltransferase)
VPDVKQFKLPDVGEGLTEAEILKWFVQPGDTVVVNQTLVEIETAKAAVELPSPYAGVVAELHVAEGQTVDVGTPIIGIDTDPSGPPVAVPAAQPPARPAGVREEPGATAAMADPGAAGAMADPGAAGAMADTVPDIPSPREDEPVEPGLIGGPAPGGRTSVLVGYGPRSVTAKRRPRKGGVQAGPTPSANPMFAQPPVRAAEVDVAHAPAGTGPVHPTPGRTGLVEQAGVGAPAAAGAPAPGRLEQGADVVVLAKPPVRKYARDLGVDLTTVTPSGPAGIITRADVEAAAAGAGAEPALSAAAPLGQAQFGPDREQRIPIKGVRKHTAAAMVASAFTAPHVTEFVTVDVTATMQLRSQVAGLPDFADVKVSPLLFVAKALLLAVRRNPMVNSSWDEAAQEIVVKEYVNLGIAAATPRGLIVPNIKDAGRLPLRDLAVALGELTETARAGRTTPADMAGGTITITNVGVFGMDSGTPILNPGESAILAFGAVREMPWVVDGAIVPRKVTQLSLSFDHRIVDGQLGSLFLADIAALLHDPTLAVAWS